jgi:hypothetical protein
MWLVLLLKNRNFAVILDLCRLFGVNWNLNVLSSYTQFSEIDWVNIQQLN